MRPLPSWDWERATIATWVRSRGLDPTGRGGFRVDPDLAEAAAGMAETLFAMWTAKAGRELEEVTSIEPGTCRFFGAPAKVVKRATTSPTDVLRAAPALSAALAARALRTPNRSEFGDGDSAAIWEATMASKSKMYRILQQLTMNKIQ